jgi:hypothetical protein
MEDGGDEIVIWLFQSPSSKGCNSDDFNCLTGSPDIPPSCWGVFSVCRSSDSVVLSAAVASPYYQSVLVADFAGGTGVVVVLSATHSC